MGTKGRAAWGLVAAALANCAGCAAGGIPHASSSPAAQNALSPPNCFSPNLYAANWGVGWDGTSTTPADDSAKVTQTSHTDFGPLVTVIPLSEGPDGQQAPVAAPGQMPSAEALNGPPGEALPELTLAEAIRLTFLANPDLKSALERTQVAEQTLANARAQFFPILASNSGYQVSDNPLNRFTYLLSQGVTDPAQLFPLPTTGDIFHTQLHFQQDLYTGGLRLARADAAEAERAAALYSLSAVRNQLVFQVAEAYYRLYQARELVGVRRETVAQVESQLQTMKSRAQAGTAVESDVLRVEVRLAESREALITAGHAVELAMAVLENVTGTRLSGRKLPPRLTPAPWSDHVNQVEAAVAEALAKRPEVSELANRRLAAEKRVRAAEAGKYPTLGVVGDYDFYAGETTHNNSYTFGLALSLNLFDGGRVKSSVGQASAQVREIIARHQRLVMDIELDVRKAALQLQDAQERLKSTSATVKSAEANLRQVESRFRGQTATSTELLEAQVLLSEVRVRSINIAADVEIARAGLERAIGRLTFLLESGAGCSAN